MKVNGVFLSATVSLSASLVAVLTAWVVVALKRKKLSVPALTAGFAPSTPVALVYVGKKAPRMALPGVDQFVCNQAPPPGWQRVTTRVPLTIAKWTLPFPVLSSYTHVVVVTDSATAPMVTHALQCMHRAPLMFFALRTNLMRELKRGRWKKYVMENTSPAWWNRLYYADTSVVVRDVAEPRVTAQCEVLARLMTQLGVRRDADVFGFLFSPLSTLALPLLPGCSVVPPPRLSLEYGV